MNTVEGSVPITLPIAKVRGEAFLELPQDLFIPPDALEIFLEFFEGPLDLLLYLIRRQNFNVLDIPIAEITRQYMLYVDLMREFRLELAAEYLVMAATLLEIKSRMLLPRPVITEEEEDPRAELVRRLQEYEQIKKAAEDLDRLPRVGRDIFAASAQMPSFEKQKPLPVVTMSEILQALREVLARAALYTHHKVSLEPLSVRARMTEILEVLGCGHFTAFTRLLKKKDGRRGVVVTFLAVLELVKQSMIDLVQTEPFQPIHLIAISVNE